MIVRADAVMFDNDGVLIDSHAQVHRAWRLLAREFDLDVETLTSELAGVRAVDTLGRHLPRSLVPEAVGRLEDLEVAFADECRPLPGAVGLLQTLPLGSYTIVTSASRRLAEARWSAAGIPQPPRPVTAESVHHGKPHPEPYLVAAEQLGAHPSRCVVFEDSAPGGEAARAAGCVVVAVGSDSWAFEPTVRINDLSAVTDVRAESGDLLLDLSPDERP